MKYRKFYRNGNDSYCQDTQGGEEEGEGGGDHFVPTRALAKGMIEVGSMKLIKAYPTLHTINLTCLGRGKGGEQLASILKINAKIQEIICPRIRDINILHKHLLFVRSSNSVRGWGRPEYTYSGHF